MPRRARGRAADSDSDSDFDPEVVTSESDEVIELDDLGEPSSARKRSKRKVRIESDEDEPRDLSAPSGSAPSSRPVRATRARGGKPKPLDLRRGIRDRSPSSSSDDVDGDTVRVTPARGRRQKKQLTTRESRRTRKTHASGTPGDASRPKWVGRVRAPQDEDPWEWGTMTDRPEFYDRRAKHGIVNMEKMSDDSSGPGSSTDDFIDDGDASASDATEGARDASETSLEAFEREETRKKNAAAALLSKGKRKRDTKTSSRTSSSSSDEPRRTTRRRGKASVGVPGGKKPSRRKFSAIVESSPSPPASEADVPSRGHRSTRSRNKVIILDDDEDAPAPAPAPGETPTKRSARLRTRRRSAAAEWRLNRERLAQGMRREEAELEYRDIEDIEREELDAEMRFDQLGGDDDDLEGFVVAEPEAREPLTRRRRSRAVLESDSESSESRGSRSGSRSESESAGWVHCECGACEDDGAPMVQCENPRCGAWQHMACVDRDARGTRRAFFCCHCASAGGKRAPAPPEKPGGVDPAGRRGGSLDESLEYQATPHARFRAAFLADDEETLRDAMADPESDSRSYAAEVGGGSIPSRRALLNRACAARAWKCLRALLGGPWTRGARDDAHSAAKPSRLPRASTEDIGNALHVSLARGDAEAAATIRSVLGEAFAHPPPFSSTRRWPLSPLGDGGTLLHSAAENDAGDARCVWLALEAEGEAPPGGFEDTAEPATAARAALEARERVSGNKTPLGTIGTHPLLSSDASGSKSSSPSKLLDKPRYVPLGDRPAASVGDETGATPLMRAAGRGEGWEACVAALLRSAAVFVNDSPFLRHGVGAGGVGARLFASGASEETKSRVANATPAARAFVGAGAAAAMRDEALKASAAHYAAGSGATASLRLLARAHPGSVRAADANGATPLHHAAACGDVECVRVLADELGASRVARDARGWIPLMYADFADELGCGLDSKSAATVLMARDLQEQLVALREVVDDPIGKPRVVRCVRSLAENPACYEALNAFLADRPELLDEGAPLEFLLRLEIPGKRGAKGEKNDGNARVSAVDFPARRAWLQRALRRRMALGGSQREWADLVSRDEKAALVVREPWNDLFRWASRRGAAGFQNAPLHTHARFSAEPGDFASGPGVERDFMERVARDLIGGGGGNRGGRDAPSDGAEPRDQPTPLLTRASDADTAYRPPHLADRLPKRLEEQYFVLGQLLGYAVLHASPLPVALASAFVRGVLGRGAPSADPLEELEEMDEQEARSLRAVKTMPAEAVEGLCLTFSLDETYERVESVDANDDSNKWRVATETKEVPLMGCGKTETEMSTPVTASNRDLYVSLRAAHQVARVSNSAAARAARAGFAELVPPDCLRSMFSTAEVALLVGGAATVDVDEMQTHARYGGGYETGSGTFPQPEWLWRFLRRALAHDRAAFLKFVTGSSRLPPGGFASLRYPLTVVRAPLYGDVDIRNAEGDVLESDSEGDAWVTRRARRGPDRGERRGDGKTKTKGTKTKTRTDPKRFPLPTAATCFNQLRLPEYPSEAILQHRIATALRHGVEGFGFG